MVLTFCRSNTRSLEQFLRLSRYDDVADQWPDGRHKLTDAERAAREAAANVPEAVRIARNIAIDSLWT